MSHEVVYQCPCGRICTIPAWLIEANGYHSTKWRCECGELSFAASTKIRENTSENAKAPARSIDG